MIDKNKKESNKKQNKKYKINMHVDSNLLPLVRKCTPLPTEPPLYFRKRNSILLIRTKNFTDNYNAQHQDLAP